MNNDWIGDVIDYVKDTYPGLDVYDWAYYRPTSGRAYSLLEVFAFVREGGYGHDYDRIDAHLEDVFDGNLIVAVTTYQDRVEMAFTLTEEFTR